jgi:hypothetical protein
MSEPLVFDASLSSLGRVTSSKIQSGVEKAEFERWSAGKSDCNSRRRTDVFVYHFKHVNKKRKSVTTRSGSQDVSI